MKPSLLTALLVAPVIGAMLTTAGCGSGGGGGGGSSAAPAPAPGTTVINGVAFAADSDELTDSPFGEAFGMRTVRNVSKGTIEDHLTTKTYTGTTVGNIRSVTVRVDFIDASGQPYAGNVFKQVLLNILKEIVNSTQRVSLAKAADGWIYFVAYGDTPFEAPIKVYPNQVTTGTEWSREGTHTKETDGVVTEVIPTRTTYRVLATDATAPWSGITGCVLLRTIEREGEVEETEWDYYKPGIGLVESTDTDPELDQSAASGSYLVPNVG